jgi:hypothetical protein
MRPLFERSPHRTVARLLTWALFAACSLPRLAQAEPSAADRESARTLMNEGDKKLAAHDAKGAMKAYQAAHEIMKVPSTGASYAQAALEAGYFVEARDACLQVARMVAAPNEPSAFQKARTSCTDIVPRADAKIATITIRVTPVKGAGEPRVTFDGVAVPSGALLVPRKVNPGKHALVASLDGYPDATSEATLAEGANKEITLTFGGPTSTKADAKSEGATASTDSLASAKPSRSALVYVGFGVGAAGFVAGGVTGLLSMGKASDAKAGCVANACPAANEDAASSSRTLGTISTIGFGVGLVGVGVGVYGLLAKRPVATTAQLGGATVTPFVGPSSLGVTGQF